MTESRNGRRMRGKGRKSGDGRRATSFPETFPWLGSGRPAPKPGKSPWERGWEGEVPSIFALVTLVTSYLLFFWRVVLGLYCTSWRKTRMISIQNNERQVTEFYRILISGRSLEKISRNGRNKMRNWPPSSPSRNQRLTNNSRENQIKYGVAFYESLSTVSIFLENLRGRRQNKLRAWRAARGIALSRSGHACTLRSAPLTFEEKTDCSQSTSNVPRNCEAKMHQNTY